MRTKVLIGEDNLVTQQVLKAMLESRNCVVTTASTFEDILTQLQNDTFSFLLLDYHLDQDADFVLGKIRKLTNSNSSIPVHIMSAGRREDVMEKLHDFKIDGFLKKPIENDQLDALLSNSNTTINSSGDDQYLRSIIGDNPDRINAIRDFFLTEVPPALITIAELLQKKDFTGVKKLVHKIRPAYTYVGRDDIQVKMGLWEDDLLQEKKSSELRKYPRSHQPRNRDINIQLPEKSAKQNRKCTSTNSF
ncbi:MAG: response regulator [Cyclobacteriaceae bacterium]